MIYAVKSVNDKEVNLIFKDWQECSRYVLGKKAVYKSFIDEEDGDAATKAIKFLESAPIKTEEYGRGYMPFSKGRHIIYVKYKFDRKKQDTNGHSVKVYENSKGERVNCTGYFLPDNKRLLYIFTGQFVRNKKYGYEFVVESFSEHITNTKDSIITYLSSGVIKGIGEKKAKAIYEKFGNLTMDVIEKTPNKLLQIKGINEKVLKNIVNSFDENKYAREITSYLLQYGIAPKYAMHLYSIYGSRALNAVKENPYIICRLRGLTFEDADAIAQKENYPPNGKERFIACANYVLKENETNTGSTGMEINEFGKRVYNILVIQNTKMQFPEPEKLINAYTIDMIKEREIFYYKIKGKQYLFSAQTKEREESIAYNLIRIRDEKKNCNEEQIKKVLDIAKGKFDIQFDTTQEYAAYTALCENITVISGGPGVGKTAVLKLIGCAYGMAYDEQRIIYLAPTGRAARKMTESTGVEAYTAHSYIHYYDEMVADEEDVTIENALVVVDEFSMADISLVSRLFNAIKNNCKCVLLGDVNQLPSVGPGAVLRDMINSGVIKTIFLKKIYRQEENSQIYLNAKKMSEGNVEILEGKDFHMTECSSMEDVKNIMIEKYAQYVKKYGVLNVMCLLPYKKHTAGVEEMNKMLQDKINPKSRNKEEVFYRGSIFREGDVVMQICNDKRAANGDIGQIVKINNPDNHIFDSLVPDTSKEDECEDEYKDEAYIIVRMNNQNLMYKKEDFEFLELAYAMSVHKSQGSEADAVVTCLTSFHKDMVYRAIPYVALTRGKKEVDFVGEKKTLEEAIKTKEKKERITLTERFICRNAGEFVPVG